MIKKSHLSFLNNICLEAASMSKDNKLKVGALLIKDGRIVTTGYNGQPSGLDLIRFENRFGNEMTTIHAEMNCLMFAAKVGIAVKDCDLIVSHYPCFNCRKHLAQAGIKSVYYIKDYKNTEDVFGLRLKKL